MIKRNTRERAAAANFKVMQFSEARTEELPLLPREREANYYCSLRDATSFASSLSLSFSRRFKADGARARERQPTVLDTTLSHA